MKSLLIAHRGFWTTNPEVLENSLEALQNAQKLEVYGSEFDVRMTKDEVLVIYHDEFFEDLEISENDYSSLENLKLSNGEKLPTLESFLVQGKENLSQKLIIELKPCKTEFLENNFVKKAVELVKKHHSEKQCEFISFSLNICKEIKTYQSNFKVSYLNGDLSPKQLSVIGLDGFDYDYEILLENTNWISEAKTLGLQSNSWTVNDKQVFQKLSNLEIDFITTDFPNFIF